MVSIVRRRWMTGIALVAAGFVLLFVMIAALVWRFQERIAFQPERGPFPHAADVARVEYKASDEQPLFAYIIGEPRTTRGLVIVFHGNADLAVRQIQWAQEVERRTGFAVMLTEYRGYMGLGGRPTYEGSRHDSEAAWKVATDSLGVAPERIVLFGHSLGTAIATELAVRHKPSGLILQSPFTSAREMAGLIIGNTLATATWPLVSRLHFDTESQVASLEVPVSVSHGGRDVVIPARMGRKVFESARVKGEWLFIPNGSHSDLEMSGGEDYWRWLTAALERASGE
jgi:uncharacterized protein